MIYSFVSLTCNCYFVAPYLFLLCLVLTVFFVLLSEEIIFRFLNHVRFFSSEISFVCRLKCPSGSFELLFPGNFCSVDDCVVYIVSDGCNQFSIELVDVVFESLYRCINAILNAGESPSFFFWDIQSVNVISSSFSLSSSLVNFKNGPKYLIKRTAQFCNPFDEIFCRSLVSCSFLVLLRYSFLIFSFISTCLMGIRFQYFHVFVRFLFSEHSDLF